MMDTLTLFSLPVEDILLPCVFCYLDPLEIWPLRLVNRALYSIIYRYYNTVCMELEANYNHGYILPVVYQILGNCPNLKRLTIIGPFNDQGCTVQNCIQSMCTIQPQLIELNLQYIELSNDISLSLVHCCKSLETLRVFSVTGLTESLDIILSDCVKLKEFHFDKEYTSSSKLTNALLQQKELEVLEYVGHHSKKPPFQFEMIILSLPSLRSLSFRYVSWLTDRSLLMITEYCHQLSHIEILHCQSITWKGLETLHKKGVHVISTSQVCETQSNIVNAKNQI